MTKDVERLEHILEAIERIEKYARRGEDSFRKDELVQTWIVSHLQIVGEAARGLSPSFRRKYSDIPWKKIVGMRNIIVHDYFQVDATVVWSVVETELSKLKTGVKNILQLIMKNSERS